MECLVAKLKGIVDDNNLRKMNEGSIKFKVIGVNPNEVGSSSYEYASYFKDINNLTFRTNRDELQPEKSGNSVAFNGVKDDDILFIENILLAYEFGFYGYSTKDGRKYIKIENIHGFPTNRFGSVLNINDVYLEVGILPPSTKISQINWRNTGAMWKAYVLDGEFDIEELYNKYPNISLILLNGAPVKISNISSISKFKTLSSLTFLNIASNNTIDLDAFTGMNNLKKIELEGNQCTGNYFGLIDGAEKSEFNASGTFKYNGETFEGSRLGEICGNGFYVDGDLDQMLINLAANATKISGGANTIKISSYRTSASDSAIQTLQSKGWTISIPGGGRAAAASTMSVMSTMSLIESNEKVESGNYRIAYQGNQLIIEPTEFPIYPAAGVTVKEFQALEEANEFISENNLSTEVE